jgi:uroporphyrinogen decarboxylase
MNARERFLNTMHFKKVDHPPLREMVGFWPETIQRWNREGLPLGGDIHDFFGYDKFKDDIPAEDVWLQTGYMKPQRVFIDLGVIPYYVAKTVEKTEEYTVFIDSTGIKQKVLHDAQTQMPQWLEYPVKNRQDWENLKRRLNPEDPRRYPLAWGDDLVSYLNQRDYPLVLNRGGRRGLSFFGWLRDLMGLKNTLYLLYDQPDLIHEMNEFHADFLIRALQKAVSKIKFDYAFFWEDMAYKTGPLISPKFFREFMLPYYTKVTDFLRGYGIDIILVDSDGNLEELIPLWLEGGVNAVMPLEVAAGMDAVKLRKRYGKNLSLIGNIDKRALIKGKEAIKKEVMYKVPYLIKEGGYIPSIDHSVPPDVSLENYLYYLQLIKKVFGIG